MLAVHIRSFLVRRRRTRRLLVLALALVAGALVATQSHQLQAARASWGTARRVWVADGPSSPGDPVRARAVDVPAALVPSDAIDATTPLEGWVTAQHVGDGEVLTVFDAVDDRSRLVPDGWRTVAVAADDTTVPVAPTDRVDVVADGVVLATDAVVVTVTDTVDVVAVPAERAAAVAAAAHDRRADLVGRP